MQEFPRYFEWFASSIQKADQLHLLEDACKRTQKHASTESTPR